MAKTIQPAKRLQPPKILALQFLNNEISKKTPAPFLNLSPFF